LMFIFINILTGRDFGPMLKAERRAAGGGPLYGSEGSWTAGEMSFGLEPDPRRKFKARFAVVPLLITLVVIIAGIIVVGHSRMVRDGMEFSALNLQNWGELVAAAAYDTQNPTGPGVMAMLSWGAIVGFALAFLMPVVERALDLRSAAVAVWKTVPTLKTALFILLMAWAMKTISQTVGADQFLISHFGENVPLWAIPALAFLLACLVSFATGTSWGSMGMLIPILLPVAHAVGADDPAGMLIFLLTAAAILDGSIFGDHCSPISDTTILSCLATRCEPIDHVVTQGAYALVVAGFALLAGYAATALGAPGWLYFIILPLGSLIIFRAFGRTSLPAAPAS
jgi:Na+/H+ antiporter NhaC